MPNTPLPNCQTLWINARLATFDPAAAAPYGALENHAIGVGDGRIAAIVPMREVPVVVRPSRLHSAGETPALQHDAGETPAPQCEVIDAGGAWITPGLIDCHTHLIHGGNRCAEIEQRRLGVSYEEIARRGGGILSTVRATRAMSEQELLDAALPRLQALMDEGVTTVEIKSGYGLALADELKMLRVARRLGEVAPTNIITTLLAAHALPPEFAGRADDYIALVCDKIIPAAAAEGLADAVDVFCERIAFSPAQCERVFAAARRHDLPIKAHAEQLSNFGGTLAAARYNALSMDHLEHLDAAGARAMADCGAAAVLLPGACYFLGQKEKPPVELLRASGVPMAVASDYNPGTCPLASLRLAMNMAGVLFSLTPEECLCGATRAAAGALGLSDRLGTLTVGKQADFIVWDIEYPAELCCQFGVPRPRQRVFRGKQG